MWGLDFYRTETHSVGWEVCINLGMSKWAPQGPRFESGLWSSHSHLRALRVSVSQLRPIPHGVPGLEHLSLLVTDGIREPISRLRYEALLGLLQTVSPIAVLGVFGSLSRRCHCWWFPPQVLLCTSGSPIVTNYGYVSSVLCTLHLYEVCP